MGRAAALSMAVAMYLALLRKVGFVVEVMEEHVHELRTRKESPVVGLRLAT